MPQEVSEEVQTGALPDEDEVSGAVGQVSRRRQAFRTAGTRAAHAGCVDSDELVPDHTPPTAAICNRGITVDWLFSSGLTIVYFVALLYLIHVDFTLPW